MPSRLATVYYHADCPDGFGAAYAAWLKFGDQARYRPLHHGEPWLADDIAGREVYILDFAFPPATLAVMAGDATGLVQIDHHTTARAPWAGQLEKTVAGYETFRHPALPLTVIFDLEKSGARLAWEHFHPGEPLPLLLRHIEDIDLWRFAVPGTRAVMRALRLRPYDFRVWDALVRSAPDAAAPAYQHLLAEGEAIERFLQTEIERLAGSRLVMPVQLRGEPVDLLQAQRHGLPTLVVGDLAWRALSGLAINADALFASELGGRLAERCGSFALVWQLVGDGMVKASLRAAGQVDVAAIAAAYGGGGHPNAAGFRMPLTRFTSEILKCDYSNKL